MAKGLQQRVYDAINKARESDNEPTPGFTADQEAIASLVAWNQGIENALAEIVLEIEKLAPSGENKPPIPDE